VQWFALCRCVNDLRIEARRIGPPRLLGPLAVARAVENDPR
jgi:hypothetical protein